MKIIYSDLDGTLLDSDTYSYDSAKDTLEKINKKNIPLIICTSKTRAEIEFFREKIDNHHPFISENGGGIFIPKNYFDVNFEYDKEYDNYYVLVLGADYNKLEEAIYNIKEKFEITSFLDMSAQEIAKDSNLSIKEAELAKKREFDIPFKVKNLNSEDKIHRIVRENNLHYTKGGRYYHLIGSNSKGKAVEVLTDIYRKQFGDVFTIGIGDSSNDFSMLESVDRGYLVMKKNEKYASSDYNPAGEIGPKGWKRVVKKELKI